MANVTDAQIRAVFDLFDADGSGWVDAEEMGLALQALGFGELSREAVDTMVSDYVIDGNTHVELSDFVKIVKGRMAPRHSPEEALKAFRVFDKQDTGKVTVDDLLQAARETGLLMPDENDAPLRALYTSILKEANVAYPSEDLHDDPSAINTVQWKAMMRAAVIDKRHKVDEAAFSLKTRARVAKKGPYGIKVEAGQTYYWCTCGMSKNQPFCDGSHVSFNKEFASEFEPVKYTADESRTVWFCGCKQTASPPFCDGSHTAL